MVIFRVDANSIIGSGHVMRDLTLAKSFCKMGEECAFITADNNADKLLLDADFEHFILDSNYQEMESELENWRSILSKLSPNIIIIDSYQVSENYFIELRKLLDDMQCDCKLIYFDDYNNADWAVDGIINYNIYAKYVECDKHIFAGTRYAPLRDEFTEAVKQSGEFVEQASGKKILISAGGADPMQITERLLTELPQYENVQFHYVVGALNPRLDDIKKLAAKRPDSLLHINEKHMADLMRSCDIAIAAAGTTLYELCACGLPTITYILADNQIIPAKAFEKEGVMLSAGDARDKEAFIQNVIASLSELINDENLRQCMSEKMKLLVDGAGADRLAKEILEIK